VRPIIVISSFGLDAPHMASLRLNRLARFLKERGRSVTVISPGRYSGGNGKAARKLIFPFMAAWMVWRKTGGPEGADVVSTIPEIEALIAGAIVKAARGKRVTLTLEVRDPFSSNALYPWGMWRRSFYRWLERRLLRWPDRAVFLTTEIERLYLQDFKDRGPWSGHRQVITNGFDPSASPKPAPRVDRPLRITHVGNFYGSRNPVAWLEILSRYLTEAQDVPAFEVVFAGSIQGEDLDRRVRTLINSEPLSSKVRWLGPVSQPDAARLMGESDVNLIITHQSGSEYAIPGKIFEYMGAGRPVLAFTRDPLVQRLMDETRLGWVCHDENDLTTWFKRYLAMPAEARRLQIDEKAIRSYHSDRLLTRWEAFVTVRGAS